MPGYGIADAGEGIGLLPWSWAVQRLRDARTYWVATTGPSAKPHLTPVWAVWFGGALYFSSGGQSRKARNLESAPECSVGINNSDEAVIVEGVARPVTGTERLAGVVQAYAAKYGMEPPDPTANPLFGVQPRVVFGFIGRDPEFTQTATRWVFAE